MDEMMSEAESVRNGFEAGQVKVFCRVRKYCDTL